jgi:hypothetical protein
MAGRAKKRRNYQRPAPRMPPGSTGLEIWEAKGPAPIPTTGEMNSAIIPVDEVQTAAARLYGLGYTRTQVARILFDHLAPIVTPDGRRPRTQEERRRHARQKLVRWEKQDKFRDQVYEQAVVQMDMKIPGILKGIAAKARHRVDAARFVLEVTGRHNPRGEAQPPNITVQIANIPRPD